MRCYQLGCVPVGRGSLPLSFSWHFKVRSVALQTGWSAHSGVASSAQLGYRLIDTRTEEDGSL